MYCKEQGLGALALFWFLVSRSTRTMRSCLPPERFTDVGTLFRSAMTLRLRNFNWIAIVCDKYRIDILTYRCIPDTPHLFICRIIAGQILYFENSMTVQHSQKLIWNSFHRYLLYIMCIYVLF